VGPWGSVSWQGMPTPCKRKKILNLKRRQCPVEGFRVPCPPHPNPCSLCLLTSTAVAGGHGCDNFVCDFNFFKDALVINASKYSVLVPNS
jgi:hypothetical protein